MKTIMICALIILIPSSVFWLIAGALKRTGNKMKKHAQELVDVFSKARRFDAKVASTEVLMGWTVIMLIPTDGQTGFYLKSTRRDIKEGEVFSCTEIPEHPERDFVLKNSQVKPDDSGHIIFTSDYERMMNKIKAETADGNHLLYVRGHVLTFWMFVILPICLIICVILYFVRRNMGIL